MWLLICEFFDLFVVIMIFDEKVYVFFVLNVNIFLKIVNDKKEIWR